MNLIHAVLTNAALCMAGAAALLILRRHVQWNVGKGICDLGIAAVMVFLGLMLAGVTFGHNSYDKAFNRAFAQYARDRTAANRSIVEREATRMKKEESMESITTATALLVCAVAWCRFRTGHPNQPAEGTR